MRWFLTTAFIVVATPFVAWFIWDQVNSRVLHLVGTDSSGRYLIYTEGKPCLEEGCFYVFRYNSSESPTTWRHYSCAKVGGESCSTRTTPKYESYESIVYKKDMSVTGKSLSFTYGGDFYHKQRMYREGDHLVVRVGDGVREDTIKFKPQL
jgi:hypothetical protein